MPACRILIGLILSVLVFTHTTASAVRVFAGTDEPDSQESQLIAECERILSNLETTSGIPIKDKQVRARLIGTLKTQPEMVLLQLMSIRAAVQGADQNKLDEIIRSVLGRMNSDEVSRREHNQRMEKFYEEQRCSEKKSGSIKL